MPLIEDEKRYIAGEEKYWLAFSRVSGIGLVRLRRLFDYFGGLQAAWEARSGDLMAAGLEPKLVERMLTFRPTFDPDSEMNRLEKLDIKLLVLDGPGYPERLAQIDNPPPALYLKGELNEADILSLAVVGTRRATSYGRQATAAICADLAAQGVTIVSGLAKGIDTFAHQAALEAGGRTLAVMGSGVDVIYPPENRALAARICDPAGFNGALLSEFAPGTQPEAVNFPPRNRIVSGLSVGVFLVESAIKGGAMITVDFASRQGREVFALPGSIYNQFSEGPNQLIRQGAKLVTGAVDILEELRPGRLFDVSERETRRELNQAGDNELERTIMHLLRQAGAPLHIDDICRDCPQPVPEISSALVLMELRGLVLGMGGMRYGLTRLAL